jgi:HK97 family phage major capsid protein
MNGVHRTPFSRIKSLFANITEDDARAKGYIKGNMKKNEFFSLMKRTTVPQTIYKKQKMDRDDIIDITDFDVVAWIRGEMRIMLDEEIARAILVGDGRLNSSDDKISEDHIRPVWTDDDLFTIKQFVTYPEEATDDDKAKAYIRAAVKARKNYKGSGNPTFYTTEDILTDMLLLEDNMGHRLYKSEQELATAMRVSKIVTVQVMEGLQREVDNVNRDLIGIIVNLSDYTVGADKGGAISMFDDFDIDYNQQKYLIETRCSGALTVPYSAIVIESAQQSE